MCEGVEFYDRYQKDTLLSFKIIPGEIEFFPLKGEGQSKILWPTEDKIELKFKIDENTSETITYCIYNFVASFLVKNFSIDEFLASEHYEVRDKIPARRYGSNNYVFMLESISIGPINEA